MKTPQPRSADVARIQCSPILLGFAVSAMSDRPSALDALRVSGPNTPHYDVLVGVATLELLDRVEALEALMVETLETLVRASTVGIDESGRSHG